MKYYTLYYLTLSVRTEYIYSVASQATSPAPFKYLTNIRTEYFKHAAQPPFFSLQNADYFIMLPCLAPVLFTFKIQGVLKF
jgi:phenylalanine-4-hydroxylase